MNYFGTIHDTKTDNLNSDHFTLIEELLGKGLVKFYYHFIDKNEDIISIKNHFISYPKNCHYIGFNAPDKSWDLAYHGINPLNLQNILKNGLSLPRNLKKEPGVNVPNIRISNPDFIYSSPSYYYSKHFSQVAVLKNFSFSCILVVQLKPKTYKLEKKYPLKIIEEEKLCKQWDDKLEFLTDNENNIKVIGACFSFYEFSFNQRNFKIEHISKKLIIPKWQFDQSIQNNCYELLKNDTYAQMVKKNHNHPAIFSNYLFIQGEYYFEFKVHVKDNSEKWAICFIPPNNIGYDVYHDSVLYFYYEDKKFQIEKRICYFYTQNQINYTINNKESVLINPGKIDIKVESNSVLNFGIYLSVNKNVLKLYLDGKDVYTNQKNEVIFEVNDFPLRFFFC